MGRFDVSGVGISRRRRRTPLKRCSNCDGLSKHARFPGTKRGGSSNVTQQTTVAIEGTAFLARLTSTRFSGTLFEILRDRPWTARWDLTRGKDVLEPEKRCADATRRLAGEGRADYERRPPEAMAKWGRGELRRLGTSCIVAAPPSRRALAMGGNSEIIIPRRAENT
jgi:hypothetical protein